MEWNAMNVIPQPGTSVIVKMNNGMRQIGEYSDGKILTPYGRLALADCGGWISIDALLSRVILHRHIRDRLRGKIRQYEFFIESVRKKIRELDVEQAKM